MPRESVNPSDVRVVPYCEIDGIRTFKDSEVMSLYEQTGKDGTRDIIFCDGEINSGQDFLHAMKYGDNLLYVVIVDDDIVGMYWLNRFKGRSCYVHFTAFSNVWGRDTVAIGRAAIREAIYMEAKGGGFVFDVLFGLIPTWNNRAIKWLHKVGLQTCGQLPNAIWDAKSHQSIEGTLLCLTREMIP